MSTHLRIASVDVDTRHWIGGRRIASSDTFELLSPIDQQPLGEICAASAGEVDEAVRAARNAFPEWAALGPTGRRPILERLATRIRHHTQDLAIVETHDNGSLLIGNEKNIVARSAHNIAFFAELASQIDGGVIAGDTVDNHVRYEPAGVAALSHALERTVDAEHVEGGSCPGSWQHRGAQTAGMGSAHLLNAG